MITGELYDEARWTPWFVHHFEPTVEHLDSQILEIFRGPSRGEGLWGNASGEGMAKRILNTLILSCPFAFARAVKIAESEAAARTS